MTICSIKILIIPQLSKVTLNLQYAIGKISFVRIICISSKVAIDLYKVIFVGHLKITVPVVAIECDCSVS